MTYKEGISLFNLRYKQITFGQKVYGFNNEEVMTLLSMAQAELNNEYYLIEKNSRSNSTAQTTVTAGTDKYYAGTTATTIPLDILKIYKCILGNTSTIFEVFEKGADEIVNVSKSSGQPSFYTLHKQNSDIYLEFDCEPDDDYTMSLYYVPRLDIYYGSGGTNTNKTFSDYNPATTGYGGSFLLPALFDNLLVECALKIAIPERLETYEFMKKNTIARQPYKFSGDIPAYSGILEDGSEETPGDDPPRD